MEASIFKRGGRRGRGGVRWEFFFLFIDKVLDSFYFDRFMQGTYVYLF
jgi:hypothetical protein